MIGGLLWFARTRQRPWLQVADFVALRPRAWRRGRVGNFINGELWGRFASPDLPWGMVFPHSGSMLPRHPSQVYQFRWKGCCCSCCCGCMRAIPGARARGQVAAGLCSATGGVPLHRRILFREPDAFPGPAVAGHEHGQWLCLPMIAGGAALWLWMARPMPGEAGAHCGGGRRQAVAFQGLDLSAYWRCTTLRRIFCVGVEAAVVDGEGALSTENLRTCATRACLALTASMPRCSSSCTGLLRAHSAGPAGDLVLLGKGLQSTSGLSVSSALRNGVNHR